VPADDLEAASDAVGDFIDTVLDERSHGPRGVLVATTSSIVRDRLREDFALEPWEHRDEHVIVGENVQRVKGLEFDHVALVVLDPDVDPRLLYVGASRAVMSLTLIAPPAAAAHLGLSG
jgi:DNA helicase IV